MAQWIAVGAESDLPAGGRLSVTAQGQNLVLFQAQGKLMAIADTCPHAGMPLADGELRGCVLTCPFHGYTFDLNTGRNVDFPDDPPVTRYTVKIDAGQLWVDMEAPLGA